MGRGPTYNLHSEDLNEHKNKKRSSRIIEPILTQKLGEDPKKKKKFGMTEGPILSPKLGEDQKKKVWQSDNIPARKFEATMTFFLTNLSLLASVFPLSRLFSANR